MTKRNALTAADKIARAIRREFDVEYIGGVGYCGPQWLAATYAAAERYAAIGEEWRAEQILKTVPR